MYYGARKIWQHFAGDVIACNPREARQLATWLRHQRHSRQYLHPLEVVDLQHYRLIKHHSKVQDVLKLPPNEQVFLFVVNKN